MRERKNRKLIKLLLLMNLCLNETNNWMKLLLLSIYFPFQINLPENCTKLDNFSDDFSSKFYFRLHETRKGVTDVKRVCVINFQIIISPLDKFFFFHFCWGLFLISIVSHDIILTSGPPAFSLYRFFFAAVPGHIKKKLINCRYDKFLTCVYRFSSTPKNTNNERKW